jgi:hypothetical protein
MTSRQSWPTVRLCASVLIASAAIAAEPSTSQTEAKLSTYEARIESLERDLDRLRRAQLSEERAEAIRGLVVEMLEDADTRVSLLETGMTAGWDSHPFLATPDGSFRLQFAGQLQVRALYTHRNNSPGDDNRFGFENRRTKLKFGGHVLDPSWRYKITGAFDDDGGTFLLEDAYVEKDFDGGWSVRAGQFKGPFMREEIVSSTRQLAVERSLVNERFNQGFMQGIQLEYAAERLRVLAMLSDGLEDANSPWSAYDTELAITARAEVLLEGGWRQFRSLSSPPGSDPALLLGVAVHHQRDESGTPAGPEEKDTRLTADMSWHGDGFNVFASFLWQDLEEADRQPFGVIVQGGYFITDRWEPFARYEYGDADTTLAEDLSVITAGFNFYAHPDVKWSTDVGWGINGIDDFWDKSSAGWLVDGAGEDGQLVLRTQLQLLF